MRYCAGKGRGRSGERSFICGEEAPVMTTAALKKKIKALVDKETNGRKLDNVLAMFEATGISASERKAIVETVSRSEADYRAGRFVSGPEARKRAKQTLKRKRAA
jgi:short subunit dehydrogenase-like uncharacterized protein